MAEKRMFAKSIIDSDQFLDMPTTAQLLYFHLCMRADDDGFINNPKRIMRDVRCSEDDMRILIAKNYIIPFESGVVVIKHWRLHNYIQKDRYKPSLCDEKNLLTTNKNKVYECMDTDCIQDGYILDTECIQNVSNMDTQIRLDKIRLDKSSSSREEGATTTTVSDRHNKTIDQEILTLYQDNIHPVTPIEAEKLIDDIERYGKVWCLEAIKRAVLRNKRTLGYVEGILRGWETNGFDDGSRKQDEKDTLDDEPLHPYVRNMEEYNYEIG